MKALHTVGNYILMFALIWASSSLLTGPMVFGAVLEEVIVTAQKREENMQDVGIAISAFSGDQIEALGYTNAQQVTALAAGVSTVQPNGEANYSFAIRGAASSDFTSNNEAPVSVYVDEVYISQMSGTGFMLFDLERVEILRGPQGTLFGRNATGGLAHFITRKPSQEFGGYGKFTVGEYEQFKFEGALGGGLTDTLSARLSVSTHLNDGYAKNRFLDKDLNNANDYAGRVQLLFEPNEDVEFLFNARYSLQQIATGFFEHAPALEANFRSPANTFNPTLQYLDPDLNEDPFTGDYDKEGYNDSETYGFSGTLKWNLGNYTLTSITDVSSVTRDYVEDTDSTPSPAINLALNTDAEQWSQEIRLNGETDRFNWVAGFYYLDIDIADANSVESNLFMDFFISDPALLNRPTDAPFLDIGCCQGIGTGTERGVDSPYTIDTQSWSLFAQVDYAINEQWSAIFGARWIEEDKDFTWQSNLVRFIPGQKFRNGNPNVIEQLTAFATSTSDGLWSAKAELDWQPNDDLLLYASWNRGTKAGGFNAPAFPLGGDLAEIIPYEPEELDAFEVGFKWSFADGRARLNAAGYYYDYSDYQAFDVVGLDALTTNREAEMFGFEAELLASPIDGLDILFGVAYNDAELKLEERKTPPVQSPKWNVSGLVRYEWPMFNGNVAIQGDANYRSKHFFSLDGDEPVTRDGYTVANARLGWTSGDEKWDVAIAVNNLFDKHYTVQQFDLSGDLFAGGIFSMIEEYYGRPRWVRGSINYRF